MAKKDGKDNLIKYSDLTPEEQRAFHAKGGASSGAARKRKADVRKVVTEVLNNEYKTVDKNGVVSTVTGIQAIIINLFKMASDPKNRNSVQSIKLILELYGAMENKAERRLLNAQIDLMEAKAKSMSAMEELNVEDLAPLAQLLRLQDKKTFGDLPPIDVNSTVKDVTPENEKDTAD